MTNVVFVVSHAALVCAEPVGGGEGDFLKPCLQTDPADCSAFTASSPEGEKGLVLISFMWEERCISPGKWPRQ